MSQSAKKGQESSASVLIVDDADPKTYETEIEILKGLGFSVTTARTLETRERELNSSEHASNIRRWLSLSVTAATAAMPWAR